LRNKYVLALATSVLIGLKPGLFFLTPTTTYSPRSARRSGKVVAIKIKIMIGSTILHYKILERLGEASLHLSYGWQGGPVRQSLYNKLEVQNDW